MWRCNDITSECSSNVHVPGGLRNKIVAFSYTIHKSEKNNVLTSSCFPVARNWNRIQLFWIDARGWSCLIVTLIVCVGGGRTYHSAGRGSCKELPSSEIICQLVSLWRCWLDGTPTPCRAQELTEDTERHLAEWRVIVLYCPDFCLWIRYWQPRRDGALSECRLHLEQPRRQRNSSDETRESYWEK